MPHNYGNSGSKEAEHVAQVMLSWLGLELSSCTKLQTLWAGYGQICAIEASPMSSNQSTSGEYSEKHVSRNTPGTQKLILKLISPPEVSSEDEGHLRKMLSYEVEQYFYDEVAPRLCNNSPVATCLASTRAMRHRAMADGLGGLTAILISDLRPEYPVAGEKRSVLTQNQVYAALSWLAKFHSSFWTNPQPEFDRTRLLLPPLQEALRRQDENWSSKSGQLWLNGGYTYLATRTTEYENLAQDSRSEWSEAFCKAGSPSSKPVAELVSQILSPIGRPYEGYIHGDVKSENLFSSRSGDQVAFFDFQYVGMGLGVCDLAKLFTCSVPLDMLTSTDSLPRKLAMGQGERSLLQRYREVLLKSSTQLSYEWPLFQRHWETALVDWCRFQASWGFWGNEDWLKARVRWILDDAEWRDWVQESLSQTTN